MGLSDDKYLDITTRYKVPQDSRIYGHGDNGPQLDKYNKDISEIRTLLANIDSFSSSGGFVFLSETVLWFSDHFYDLAHLNKALPDKDRFDTKVKISLPKYNATVYVTGVKDDRNKVPVTSVIQIWKADRKELLQLSVTRKFGNTYGIDYFKNSNYTFRNNKDFGGLNSFSGECLGFIKEDLRILQLSADKVQSAVKEFTSKADKDIEISKNFNGHGDL